MESKQNTKFRWGMTVFLILEGLGFYYFLSLIHKSRLVELSLKLRLAEIVGWISLSFLLVLTIYSWIKGSERIIFWIHKGMDWLQWFRLISLPSVIILFVLFPNQILGDNWIYLENHFTRLAVYFLFGSFCATLLNIWWREKTWIELFVISLLILAAVYNVKSYESLVSSYPLSLSWSEGSRYYYSSTFFSEQLYGQTLPWPHNHFSRYLMQSVPFLIPTLSLWAHRLWQVILMVIFPYLGGFFLARRLKLNDKVKYVSTAIWGGLFFFQGPVFYQMLVMVILLLWLFDSQKLWRSSIVVVVASIWAGCTRINWVPMPGLIAASIYLLEQKIGKRDMRLVVRYLIPPTLWIIGGGVVGLAVQNYYVMNSGLPSEILYGYLSSDLLWYRLWPNLSNPTGIIPGILLITGPLLFMIYLALKGWKQRWYPIRLIGLGVILLILFLGGMVVSVKIGGGTNLHNFDAYLTILLIISSYLFFGKFVEMNGSGMSIKPNWILLPIVIMIPPIFAVLYGGKAPVLDFEVADEVLERIQLQVDRANEKDGEILFISQRHLITFNYIENVELVHDYEKMILMEMAMANNQAYLDMFTSDIENKRFSLIIHDGLPGYIKNKDEYSFSAENNVYLERVATVIRCNYEEKRWLSEYGVLLLIPKINSICE